MTSYKTCDFKLLIQIFLPLFEGNQQDKLNAENRLSIS